MAKVVAGSLNLIPVFSFFSFKRDVFLMAPLGSTAVSHLRPRFAYILGNYGHARSQGVSRCGEAPLVHQVQVFRILNRS